jgi:DnaJ domain
MTADPLGYYARLGVSPDAEIPAITAAFRRAARQVHPDIPRTGNAEAFVALQAAYGVLSDPVKRAAYDRKGRDGSLTRREVPFIPVVPRFGLSGLPLILACSVLGMTIVAVAGAIHALMAVNRITATAPQTAERQAAPPTVRRVLTLIGPWTDYVTPGNGPAILWQEQGPDALLRPVARLPAFAVVRAIGALPDRGLVMIALAGGAHAYVDGGRLSPGGLAEARRGFCADQAGAPPKNAEVLGQRGSGSARVVIHNRGEEPAVVKLRDTEQHTQAMIFLAPGVTATVLDLPGGPWRADFAVGELWSRACGIFAAGMDAGRLPGLIASGSAVTVPPTALAVVNISDQAFRKD